MSYEAPKAEVRDHELTEYRDSTQLTQWTKWLLYADVVMAFIGLWSGWIERRLLESFAAGAYGSQQEMEAAATANDMREGLVGLLVIVVTLTSAILMLCWIYRMCHNARVRAKFMEYTPGWSVGWFFIPIANVWKPFQAMKEIWQESARQAGPQGRDGGGLLGGWWALWIASSVVGYASLRVTLRINDVDDALLANTFGLVENLLAVPLNIIFLRIVMRLSAMQEYAHENPLPPEQEAVAPGANWA
jgi:hypothetical protein